MRAIIILLFFIPLMLMGQISDPEWQLIMQSVTTGEGDSLNKGLQWIELIHQEENRTRKELQELDRTLGHLSYDDPAGADYQDRIERARSNLQQKLNLAHSFFSGQLKNPSFPGSSPAFQACLLREYASICTGDLEILQLTFLETAVAIARRSLPLHAPLFEMELARRYLGAGLDRPALSILLDMDSGVHSSTDKNGRFQKDRFGLICRIYLNQKDYKAASPYAKDLMSLTQSLYHTGELSYREAVEDLLLCGDIFAGLPERETAKSCFDLAVSILRVQEPETGSGLLQVRAYGKAACMHDILGDPSWKTAFDQQYTLQVLSGWLSTPDGLVDSLHFVSTLFDIGRSDQAIRLLLSIDLHLQQRDPLCQYLTPSGFLRQLRILSRHLIALGEVELAKKIQFELVTRMKFQIFYAQEAVSNFTLSQWVDVFREDFRQYMISNLLSPHPELSKMAFTWHSMGSEINNLIRNNEQAGISEARDASGSFENNLYKEWVDLKGRLSERYSGGYTGEEDDIIDKERRLLILENEMRLCHVFLKDPTSDGVFGKIETNLTESSEMAPLRKDESIVEFVRINFNGKDFEPTDEVRYFAISRKNAGEPETLEWDEELGMVKIYIPPDDAFQLTYLFEEAALKNVIGHITGSTSDGIAALYRTRGAGAVHIPGTSDLDQLYKLIWQPLESQFEGITKIYYSKSGLLNQIAIAALPMPSGTLLAERFELFTKNGTDRLSIEYEREGLYANTPDAVFYGGIDFDAFPSEAGSAHQSDPLIHNSLALLQDAPERGSVANWPYLEGTYVEVEKLTKQFQSSFRSITRFEASFATEGSFKKLGSGERSPDVLHLATHGFFLPVKTDGHSGEPGFGNCENPLIRSGLLMAGGNRTWSGGNSAVGPDDGILTAYEISVLDLTQTKLVVLSACETGLGDLQGTGIGEEIHGLQRAFKLSGVDYIIMSLWKIPDAETVAFMESIYAKWLSGMDIRQAFRATQLALSREYDPYVWAAFVLIN